MRLRGKCIINQIHFERDRWKSAIDLLSTLLFFPQWDLSSSCIQRRTQCLNQLILVTIFKISAAFPVPPLHIFLTFLFAFPFVNFFLYMKLTEWQPVLYSNFGILFKYSINKSLDKYFHKLPSFLISRDAHFYDQTYK